MVGWAIVFGGGAFAVWDKRDPAVLGLIVAVGFMTVLLAQLDRFEMLKGAGIEVKVRRVEAAKREVERALKEAKQARQGAELAQQHTGEVTAEFATQVLGSLQFSWLQEKPTLQSKIEIRDRLLELLTRVGVSSEERERVASNFNSQTRKLLALSAYSALTKSAGEKGGQALQKESRSIPMPKHIGPTTEDLERFAEENQLAGGDLAVALKVLRDFEATGKLSPEFSELEEA